MFGLKYWTAAFCGCLGVLVGTAVASLPTDQKDPACIPAETAIDALMVATDASLTFVGTPSEGKPIIVFATNPDDERWALITIDEDDEGCLVSYGQGLNVYSALEDE